MELTEILTARRAAERLALTSPERHAAFGAFGSDDVPNGHRLQCCANSSRHHMDLVERQRLAHHDHRSLR